MKVLISRQKNKKSGFTLLEILFVISLLMLITVAFVPNLKGAFRVGAHTAVKTFGSLVKFSYDQAVLTGRLHRILIDFDTQKWVVESASQGALPLEKFKEEIDPKKKDANEVQNSSGFQVVESRFIQPVPRGIRLVRVKSWRYPDSPEGVSKGTVAIYILPSGYIDDASLFIAEDDKIDIQQFVVTIKSLTGRVAWTSETYKK